MHRNAAKFVPKVLTQDQKDSRVAICQELKETVKNDRTLLLNVITGDESIGMLTTHRQNCNLHNGRVLGLEDPKRKTRIEKDAAFFL